jgi:NAD(P)-dependent dehydrogenase (short-subunit alcohol dehydrogenase family)
MFAKKLAEKLKGKGIRVFSIDPGGTFILAVKILRIDCLPLQSCPVWATETFHGGLQSSG